MLILKLLILCHTPDADEILSCASAYMPLLLLIYCLIKYKVALIKCIKYQGK